MVALAMVSLHSILDRDAHGLLFPKTTKSNPFGNRDGTLWYVDFPTRFCNDCREYVNCIHSLGALAGGPGKVGFRPHLHLLFSAWCFSFRYGHFHASGTDGRYSDRHSLRVHSRGGIAVHAGSYSESESESKTN